jgi:hypothetical protein
MRSPRDQSTAVLRSGACPSAFQNELLAIWTVDPPSGSVHEVSRLPVGEWNLFPNGEQLADIPPVESGPRNRIAVASLEGKLQEEIFVAGATNSTYLDVWSDGRGFFLRIANRKRALSSFRSRVTADSMCCGRHLWDSFRLGQTHLKTARTSR